MLRFTLTVVWMLFFYGGDGHAERRAGGPFVGDRPQQVEDEYVLEPDDLAPFHRLRARLCFRI